MGKPELLQIDERLDGTELRLFRAVDERADSRLDDGPNTHHTRLDGDVQSEAGQPVVSLLAGRFSERNYLRMGRGIDAVYGLVESRGNDLPVIRHDGADGNFAQVKRFFRFREGEPHHVLLVRDGFGPSGRRNVESSRIPSLPRLRKPTSDIPLRMQGIAIDGWLRALEARHARGLSFRELRTGVVALSRIYVEGREKLERGAVFQGRAKKAAFACYYTPLHFLLVREVTASLGLAARTPRHVLDLGCGLGAAGAAVSLATSSGRHTARVDGIDRNPWAVAEARRTLAELGLEGRMRQGLVGAARIDGRYDTVVAAFTVNELSEPDRASLLATLLERRGTVLVVEPIARRTAPWWDAWARAFEARGGRADTWRFPAELPESLQKLDRASGLDHRELTARTIFLRTEPRKRADPYLE